MPLLQAGQQIYGLGKEIFRDKKTHKEPITLRRNQLTKFRLKFERERKTISIKKAGTQNLRIQNARQAETNKNAIQIVFGFNEQFQKISSITDLS